VLATEIAVDLMSGMTMLILLGRQEAKSVQGGSNDGVTDGPRIGGLDRVRPRSRPPVHLWNPPFCGTIDMRIAADGTWYYLGGPITRKPLVELFASILRKDDERYVLVTPVEMVEIAVEDAPFVATAMRVEGSGTAQRLTFTSNVGDEASADAEHPLRFERQENGGYKPYVMMRDDLWAKVPRSLYADLVDLGTVEQREREPTFGVFSAGTFFPIAPAAELGAD